MPLPAIEDLLHRQRAYYELLGLWESRPWGFRGLCLENPTSHDGNHCHVTRPLCTHRFLDVLAEAEEWYRQHAVQPRVRYTIPPGDPSHVGLAREMGWRARLERETWRAWPVRDSAERPPPVPDLEITVAGPEDLRDLMAVEADRAPEPSAGRIRTVCAKLLGDASTTCLLGRVEGEPAAALACVWRDHWGSVECVETREPFRRRGICTRMLYALQRLALASGAEGLYLYDVAEAPDRLYARAGFELVARLTRVCLWL